MLIFISCQSHSDLNLTEHISSIDVYQWDETTLLMTIDDPKLITELVKLLNRANTDSTANMGYPLPDYKLIFKDSNDQRVLTLGYYVEIVNLGVKGRYIDVPEDIMYQVDLQLPLSKY